MGIVWFLIALAMITAALSPFMFRRRAGVIRTVHPNAPDAADPAAYGFVRQEDLDVRLPGPDQDLEDVLDVVQGTQRWRAASQLLAGTPAEGELRWQRVQAFAGAAALELRARPGAGALWMRSWRTDGPKDPGGAAVHAEFLAQQAFRTAVPGTDEFRIILEEAQKASEEAALLAPGDPVPRIVRLAVARGLRVPHAEFDRVWADVIDLAPAHMGAHLAALRYWSAKWCGSRQEADAFAVAAAARAPQGSLLAALPLFSLYEHLPELVLVRDFFGSETVSRALRGAMFAVHAARPDDPVLPLVRHLLVMFLVRSQRWAEAMSQIVRVDGHVGAVPWTYDADPAGRYALYRALAVAGYEANGGSPATLPH